MERRTFLKTTGALGAGSIFGAFTSSATNAATPEARAKLAGSASGKPLETESNDLTPYSGPWGDTQLRHLLRRSMFGVPPAQFATAKALGGMNAVVDKLLAASDTTKVPLPPEPNAYMHDYLIPSRTDQTVNMNHQRLDSMREQQLINWWFDLMVQEDLSIREKMTLFWTNHFVTGYQAVQATGFMYTYLNTCRANALGNFKTFAQTIAQDPAMIVYLNSNQNYVIGKTSHINENFARELMELFTLGILDPHSGTTHYNQPNYTEADIQNSARALTGWQPSIYYMSGSVTTPTAPFIGVLWDGTGNTKAWHDTGTKTFLSQTGNFGLSDIINIIFEQGTPAGYTPAFFICQELYQNFVYNTLNLSADQLSVIDAMARLMVQNNFDITPVMRALLSSAHFYDVNVIGAQLKSPAEYMGSLVREFALTYPAFETSDPLKTGVDGTGVDIYADPNPTLSLITSGIMGASQGQQLLDPPNVKGWPGGHNWVSTGTFQQRENYSYAIIAPAVTIKNYPGFSPDLYAGQIPNDTTLTDTALSQALEDTSLAFTLGPIEGGAAKAAISALYQDPNYKYDPADIRTFAQYLTGLPEFQLL